MQLVGYFGVIYAERKEAPMFIIVGSLGLLLLVALSGADVLVSGMSSDELSNMGVERKA
jgi:hypothetical protein